MRVLHVDPERAWGGGEVQVLALVSVLAARGHASTVAAHPEGPLARAAATAGARVVPLGIANHFDLRAALVLRRLALGFGRYRTAAPAYYAAYPAADRRSHAHNNFLQMAAEAGLAGLAAFGLVYATVLRRGAETIERAPDGATWAAAAGAWAGVVGFLVGGLTQYTFGDAEVAIAMWVALAILARLGEEG